MVSRKRSDKKIKTVPLSHSLLEEVKEFVSNLNNLTPSERLDYFEKKISRRELELLIEIVYNYLRGNIKTDFTSHSRLKRNKQVLYNFISRAKSFNYKKKILNSLKGLNIFSILIPLVLNTLN